MTEQDKIIRENMRTLRKHYHRTQEDLAAELGGCRQNYYSMVEKGNRPLPEDWLSRISSIFSIPVSALVKPLSAEYLALRDNRYSEEEIVPLFALNRKYFSSKEAEENEHFAKALDYYLRIILTTTPISSMVTECQNLFYKSFKEGEIIWGAANTINVLLYRYDLLGMQDIDISSLIDSTTQNVDFKTIQKAGLLLQEKRAQHGKPFIKENNDLYNECIIALKNDEITAGLAEYLIARKYLVGMVDNEESTHTNYVIGVAMMEELALLGNKYAKYYITCCHEHIIKNVNITDL